MKISIIMISWSPTEERLKLLHNTINSLMANTFLPYELIVVDNGPKEQTKLLQSFKIDKLIINKKNMGIGYARNQGREVAEGDYIVFIDSDMKFFSGWLEPCIKVLEESKDERIIVAPMKARCHRRLKYYIGEYNNDFSIYEKASPGCWICRKSIFDLGGSFPTHSSPGTNYVNRIRQRGFRFLVMKKPKVKHMGLIPSFNFCDKLVEGEWLNRPYWNRIWKTKWEIYIKKHQNLYKEIKKLIRGEKVIDLGCGVCGLHLNAQYNLTGIDISKEGLDKCKEIFPQGEFFRQDLHKLKFNNNSFDTVLLISVIEHFYDFNEILSEAKRICKKRGLLIIVVPIEMYDKDHKHPKWNEEKIQKEIMGVLGWISYYKFEKWWVIEYQKT